MLQIKRFLSTKRPYLFVYPICAECKNYIKYTHDSLSRCKKIAFKNHKNDELEYEYADYVRRNRTVCGYEGKSFDSIYKSRNKEQPISNSPITFQAI